MGTIWPFEVLNYECRWPQSAYEYVRGQQQGTNGIDYGLTIPISSTYTPKLMPFQEPDGHAILNSTTFYTKTNGYSLLQLTGTDANGDDNIWFLTVHSIMRDDPKFDLTPYNWPVAVEALPLPTAISLEFDGTSAYLQTPITNELSGSFTVEGYFLFEKHPLGTTLTNQTLFFKSANPYAVTTNATDWLDFKVEVNAVGNVQASLGSNAVSLVASKTVDFDDTTWHHIALVLACGTNATNGVLYLDDVSSGATLTHSRSATNAGALYVGMNATPGTNSTPITPCYFKGKVDDIRVWNRALSAAEITNSLPGFLHTAATDTNVVAYYPIDDGVGRVIDDASTNGNDAAMVNCIRFASGAFGLTEADVKAYSQYHGYIYEPVSGNNYNPNLYVRPDTASTNNDSSLPDSHIFAVNKTLTGGKPMEIWWSSKVLQTDMPEPIWFPSWVQCYRFGWLTNVFSYPEIVLASQQGSANESLVKRGVAVDFSKSVNSMMTVPAGDWFAGNTFTVECWVKPNNFGAAGQVFDFGNAGPASNKVALTILPDGHIQYLVTGSAGDYQTISPTNAPPLRLEWNHLALVMDVDPQGHRQASIYQDSYPVCVSSNVRVASWTGTTTNNYLAVGVNGGVTNSFDGQIDDFAVWGVARSETDIYHDILAPLTGGELDLLLYYPFDDDVGYTSTSSTPSPLPATLPITSSSGNAPNRMPMAQRRAIIPTSTKSISMRLG